MTYPTEAFPAPATRQPLPRSRIALWAILAVSAAGACLCSIVCIVPLVIGQVRVAAERAPVETVLTTYMRYMAAKDVDSAFLLFSPHMQAQTPFGYMQNLVNEGSFAMFSGFQSLTVDRLILGNEASPDPTKPQGATARVTGGITYSDGFTGSYVAILESVNGTWKIYSVTVTVPQNKGRP